MDKQTTVEHPAGTVDRDICRLGVSRYDRVSGILLALLALVGMAVLIMFVIWLTNQIFLHYTPNPVLAGIGAQDDDPGGGSDNIELPQEEEIIEKETEETLEAVIATRVTMIPRGPNGDGPNGDGPDGPDTGPDRGPKGPSRNWQIQFIKGNTTKTYARQLDFFKIELAVLRPGNKIEYVYDLASTCPKTRTGPADKDERYHFLWRRGSGREADRELLGKAGIEPGQSPIYKMVPPDIEKRLLYLEQEQAGSRVKKLRMTRFGILPKDDGYRFYVMRQTYR